ncbi:hypothetical protein [Acidianus sp. HS-5]|uniref:hypothetical protein n=1 Tax=Acidianus sp. HS-5 TaxID=2886040 RepID=UPI001F35EE34|nr:hypothetical protein [Acidianus sp. HS-5]BDC19443.1 hypothetical protein HS5_23330 [Acidianus sp. HS-5]
MELKIELPEDLIIPPLDEFSYACNGEITNVKCDAVIYRDEDKIIATPYDIIYSISLENLTKNKTRGRKYNRWTSYISKYKLSIEPIEFSTILKTGAIITIFADGIDINGTFGDVVIKEFKISGIKNCEEIINTLKDINPRLIVIKKESFVFTISAYKVAYIDKNLQSAMKEFLGYKRMECEKLVIKNNTRICYISS